ncbi:1640_t:CDS:1 [Cetraspora pellucida]|uniref:1640_t:CDS:1 n=1 Tax=Cetraspora pellucida TaxID=1433469 RepID=A0A9N9H088_9GLOM|nr:1640_t:CDS:1 [Cetraspora pellucida]
MAQGPMQALAIQIAVLVQQLQGTPHIQVNVPETNRELSTISYQDFYGGDQDPIIWLEDIKKAFDANIVSDNRKISVIVPKLRRPAANWWVMRRIQHSVIDR